MAALPSEYYLNVGSCAFAIIEVKWATDLFDIPFRGYDGQLPIDLYTKRLRAEFLSQVTQGAYKNVRLPVFVDLVRRSEHQASLLIVAKTCAIQHVRKWPDERKVRRHKVGIFFGQVASDLKFLVRHTSCF
jgi:hypothetical protein